MKHFEEYEQVKEKKYNNLFDKLTQNETISGDINDITTRTRKTTIDDTNFMSEHYVTV